MGNRSTGKIEGFGDRLYDFRKQSGLTQEQLAKKTNLSRRMIVYYESQGGEPDAHVVVKLAKALKVSSDALLGHATTAYQAPRKLKLWRTLLKVEDFPSKEQKMIADMIDALDLRRNTQQPKAMAKN